MTPRTSHHFLGLHPGGGMAQRRCQSVARLMLLLGLIVPFALADLRAQPGPVQDKKVADPPKSPPPPPVAPPQPGSTSDLVLTVPAPSFRFNIDPKSSLKELLPTPPKGPRSAGPLRGNDLSRVPEVRFEAPQGGVNAEAMQHIAHQIAKINHLNTKKMDGFIEALRSERPDLNGLPFAMGDACRTKGEHSKQFALAVATVRQAMRSPTPVSGPAPAIGPGGGRVGSGFAPPPATPGFNAPVEFRSGAVRSAQNGLGGGGPGTVFVNVSNAAGQG